MRAIEAKSFSGYGGLRQTELPKPQSAKDRVLVRVTAAGVTPLEYTVLSGGHPRAKAPLVLGNEGAGVIEDAGDSGLECPSRRFSEISCCISSIIRRITVDRHMPASQF
jgi:NADPH2:quinone reductase